MYKKITLIVLTFFASIFLVACGKSPDVTANAKGTKIGDTIKIGVNMELTGAVAAYGKSEQNGIKSVSYTHLSPTSRMGSVIYLVIGGGLGVLVYGVLALVTHMADQLLGARAGRLRAKLHIK